MTTESFTGSGTAADPWTLSTPPGKSTYKAHRDEASEPPAVVVQVGGTQLRYHLRAITDLHEMLAARGDWVALGNADEQKPAPEGSVEAWARSPDKSGRRLVRPQDWPARTLRQLHAPDSRGPGARRGRAQRPQQPDARPVTESGCLCAGRLLLGEVSFVDGEAGLVLGGVHPTEGWTAGLQHRLQLGPGQLGAALLAALARRLVAALFEVHARILRRPRRVCGPHPGGDVQRWTTTLPVIRPDSTRVWAWRRPSAEKSSIASVRVERIRPSSTSRARRSSSCRRRSRSGACRESRPRCQAMPLLPRGSGSPAPAPGSSSAMM